MRQKKCIQVFIDQPLDLADILMTKKGSANVLSERTLFLKTDFDSTLTSDRSSCKTFFSFYVAINFFIAQLLEKRDFEKNYIFIRWAFFLFILTTVRD